MPIGAETALRLMIVDDSVEDAESIVSAMRNAGIAVRPLRPASAEELGAMIAGQQIDLVLAAQQSNGVPLDEVLQLVKSSGKDMPVIAVADHVDEKSLSQAFAGGVRAIALRNNPQQLLGAVRTEWSDLEARRSLRRLEAQVRETERRCDALIESSREPIAYVHEGMHIRANGAYLEMFGFESFDDIEGMSLLDLVSPQHVEGFKQLLKSMSKGEAPPPRYELEAHDIEGNSFPAVMEFTPALYEGEPCLQVVFRRQEVDPELAREVEELRQRDQVTGLLNRPTFLRVLEDAVAAAAQNQGQYGLLLLEPDHYQRLLQEIGLDSADALLEALAERLRSVIDDQAQAARFGEHSLAVLVRADHVATTALAERIREAFASHVFEIGSRSSAITASIGGVQIGEKIASVTQVLAKANHGVQSSIAVGGNRCEVFDPSAVDRAEEERIQAWVSRLRDALDHNRFLLYYQPVISLQGEPGATYETYIRLDAGRGEMVPPLSFLQIAEEHGLLWEIDRWVVGHAIDIIGQRARAGQPTTLLVKITQASLADDSLARYVGEQLALHKVSGEYLVLQLPEAKVFTNLRASQEFVAAVAAHKCRVGLEQFGVGLDSFQLLSHFDPSFIKLDRSFMEDLAKNTTNQQRVRDIATKARSLGIRSIAEFVQDAASMSFLFSSGIDYVEGHFLAPAGPEMNYDFE
ncbi:EAL domain-containing response regulator [Cognatiluteimonas telluris]|jgi:diguanylate cyclase (GGDEF)-like protein/PAS domain S-box-containing protein|uniref:EAL domain-containing response regulator n=1 Tax=Cognatiluteimonas telluris TaxID=1104775 RepID=UPI00140BB09C|nr:EAL domain-containing protein [Lysobacter telluris]